MYVGPLASSGRRLEAAGVIQYWNPSVPPPPAPEGLGGWLTDVGNFGRKALRYYGVAMTTVVTGGFVKQPFMRKTFGLSATESKLSEIALKSARVITTTAVGVGVARYAMGFRAVPVTAGSSSLSPTLSLTQPGQIAPGISTAAAAPSFSSVPIATSATFGGAGSIGTGAIANVASSAAAVAGKAAAAGGGILSSLGKAAGDAFLFTRLLTGGGGGGGFSSGFESVTGQPPPSIPFGDIFNAAKNAAQDTFAPSPTGGGYVAMPATTAAPEVQQAGTGLLVIGAAVAVGAGYLLTRKPKRNSR